jgi:Tfp pilus assembly protein PilF
MKRLGMSVAVTGTVVVALLFVHAANSNANNDDLLWQYRNLGKAFYENPTTQLQAVGEFKKALDLAPNSARERINYGLALLRAGKTKEGIVELEKAQKQDPKIPHTWFNLGIVFKKESEYDKAIQQLEQMIKLIPDEPVSHYNLGVLYKLTGKAEQSLQHFEKASKLDGNLAGPHFQLYNAYRQAGRTDEASRELKVFQEIKKKTAGAAVPEDMEWSFFSEIYDVVDPVVAPAGAPALKFTATPAGVTLDSATAHVKVMDVNGDGKADVLAWSSGGVHVLSGGKKTESGLDALKNVTWLEPGDYNNDGFADLAALAPGSAELYKNQNGKFSKAAVQLPAGRYRSALWVDFDHDYDLDLMLLGDESRLVRNNGEAGFSDETASFPFVPGKAVAAVLYEQIADTNGFDIVVLYDGRSPVLYRDRLLSKFEAIPLETLGTGATEVHAADFNNDGWMDLAFASATGTALAVNNNGKLEVAARLDSAKAPIFFADLGSRAFFDLVSMDAVFRNHGRAKFESAGSPLGKVSAASGSDFDGDGKLDVVAAGSDGKLQVFKNESAGGAWISTALLGVKNMKLAPGAEVEVKAGNRYQKKVYAGLPLVFGLGDAKLVDTVRITWPNGLIQNEPKQPVSKAASYKEAQRLSGSCPMIFTWDGKQFRFITDVLGVAPLGASAGDGQFFPVDHDEYIQIPGDALSPIDGKFEIRITEELREVAYVDHLRLITVDHPAHVEIFTNDKFKAPPFPEFRLYGVKKRVYPVSAWQSSKSHTGAEVKRDISSKDRAYPTNFKRDYAGVAEEHELVLDFGDSARENRAVLILHGWVDWADGSTFIGASQSSKRGLIMPYLQVKDAKGEWQTVIEDMGIPAGKPKTIAVDLTGKFLSGSRQVRIVTNLCVYWDEIFLSESVGKPEVFTATVSLASAELRFRGFSKPVIHPERKQPEEFLYSQWMPASMWNPTRGLYTKYGDVQRLLSKVDDQLLIMGSGDEMRLQFDAQGLAPLSPGWRRDFLLLVDGWAKDGDANTAYSQTVEPLPFHGMSTYPYPPGEAFQMTEIQREYTTRPALRLLRPLSERR